MSVEDGILDPAHSEEVVVAGVGTPEEKEKTPDEVKVSEDGNQIERGGIKYLRAEAVHAAREETRKYKEAFDKLEPVLPEFEEFMRTKGTRQAAVQDRATRSVAAGPKDEDDYLNEVAVALGFYDEQNQPDLRRAQAHLNISRREAERAAAKAVEPVTRATRAEAARTNRERANARKFVDGRPIADAKYLDAAFDSLGPELSADPDAANLLQVVAAGLEYLDARKNGTLNQRGGRTRSGEPMFVEQGGSRFDAASEGELSALDLAAARARGKTPEQWAKMLRDVNPERGRTNLEDV